MKWIALATCAWSLTSLAIADTPESIAEQYLTLTKEQKWDQLAELHDPRDLRELREILSWLNDLDDAKFNGIAARFYGAGKTKADVAAMSDTELYSCMLGANTSPGQFDFKQIRILGAFSEGDDMKHVLARITLAGDPGNREALHVVSLRKTDLGWRIIVQCEWLGLVKLNSKYVQDLSGVLEKLERIRDDLNGPPKESSQE